MAAGALTTTKAGLFWVSSHIKYRVLCRLARTENYLLDANGSLTRVATFIPSGPEFWDWLVHLGEQGRVKVPGLRESCWRIALGNWLRDNREALVFPEEVSRVLVALVIEQGYASDLTEDEIQKLNEDPFIVAYALPKEGGAALSRRKGQDQAERGRMHIPDVCDVGVCQQHIPVHNELDFRTDWNMQNT